MRSLNKRGPNGEKGAVLVFVAVGSIALLAIGSLVIDLGMQRTARRNLITATDSASLNLAQRYASTPPADPSNCSPDAQPIVTLNYGANAVVTSCVYNPASGVVTVAAEDADQPALLSKLLGRDKLTSSAATSALSEPSLGGLRPFAFCAGGQAFDGTPLQGVLNSVVDPNVQSGNLEFPFTFNQPDTCVNLEDPPGVGKIVSCTNQSFQLQSDTTGSGKPNGNSATPGDWGLIDFTYGSGSSNDIDLWVREGYPRPSDPQVSLSTGDCLEAKSGAPNAGNQNTKALCALVTTNSVFAIPIIDLFGDPIKPPTGPPPGPNNQYHLGGFAAVELQDFKLNGSSPSCDDPTIPITSGNDAFVFKFWGYQNSGTCCDQLIQSADALAVTRICGVTGFSDSDCL